VGLFFNRKENDKFRSSERQIMKDKRKFIKKKKKLLKGLLGGEKRIKKKTLIKMI